MADAQPFASPEDALEQIVNDARNSARLKFDALWDELAGRLERHLVSSLDERGRTGREQGAGKVRRQFSSELNQVLRRLRYAEGETRWASALLEATANLCDRAALFLITDGLLHLQGARGIMAARDFGRLPLADAPAFSVAADTRDTVVALRSRNELSGPVAALVGERQDRRCWLFPVRARDRLVAILYADAEDHIEIEALELVTGIAGLALERSCVPASNNQGAWTLFPTPDAHHRARRFARVEVARIELDHAGAVREGRRRRDLYACLRAEIDGARDTFRRNFLQPSPAMPDYLHQELLRTLANNEGNVLGPEYPGPMD